MSAKPIIVEQVFHASVGLVWKAITDPSEMRQWYFAQMESFKAEVGFQTQFDVAFEGKHFVHQWRVTEVHPRRKIAYTWKYAGYAGDSNTAWELIPEGSLTKLRLTVEGLETFPQDIPEFTRESCIQGWNYFLGERLRKHLEGSGA